MEVAKGFTDMLYAMLVLLFNEVFTPAFTEILAIFFEFVIGILALKWSYIAYRALVWLCSVLDGLERIIGVFAGVENVVVENRPMTFMEMVFQLDVVSRGFLVVTTAAVGIAFIFTIISTVRSISSMTLENKNPISQVLKDAMKACVSFMLVPFLCVGLLQLSSVLTKQIQSSVQVYTDEGANGSMGLYLFLTSSLRAGRKGVDVPILTEDGFEIIAESDILGVTTLSTEYLEPDMGDALRTKYLNGERDYLNIMHSGTDFSVARIDYVLGFVGGIFMIIMLAGVIIQFIRRMLELVMLYLVSPFFVAAIPLDRGEMFKRWREMFIAKFLSGFGVIFALKIFMLLLPLIFSSNLNLGHSFVMDKLYYGDVYDEALDTLYDEMRQSEDQPGVGMPQTPPISGGQEGAAEEINEKVDRLELAMDHVMEQSGMPAMKEHGVYEGVLVNLGFQNFNDPSYIESFIDSFLKLIFFLGGMFAVYRCSSMFLEILNPKAAEDAKASTMLAMATALKAASMAKKVAVTGAEAGFALGSGLVTAGVGTALTAGAVGAKTGVTVGAKTAGAAAKTVGSAAKTVSNTAKSAAKSAGKTAAGTVKQGVESAVSGAANSIKGSGDKEG